MLDHQEIELKWALTAQAHDLLLPRLVTELGPATVLRQVNRFYDTAALNLRAARMNLRIRQENERFVLTCKHRSPNAGATLIDGVADHREWEVELPPELARDTSDPDHMPNQAWSAALPLPDEVRAALAGQPLHALGGFANCRHEFHTTRAGLSELLCLDRTDYVARIDHELEIETADPLATSAFWRTRLAAWNIPWQAQTLTKFARFLTQGA